MLGRSESPKASSLSTENSFKSALSAAPSRQPTDFEQESPADTSLPEPLDCQELPASVEASQAGPGCPSDLLVSQATDASEGSQPDFPGRYPAEYSDVPVDRANTPVSTTHSSQTVEVHLHYPRLQASPSSPQSSTRDMGEDSDDDDGDSGQVENMVELSEYDAAEKLAQDYIVRPKL